MKEKIIFKTIVGSQAYGTSLLTSDIDYKGIYIQPNDDILSFRYNEQIEIGKDECYYEVRRFLQLAQSANPTILEMLFVDDKFIIETSPQFELLRQHKNKFLTKKCCMSFGGYAVAQIQKAKGLNKKMNWENKRIERKTPLDFCYVYSGGKSVELKKWLAEKQFKQELCGLTSLPHFRYMYNIWYDHVKDLRNDNPKFQQTSDFNFKGILQSEENSNDISLSEVPEWYHQIEGLMYFNKDEYSVHCKDYKSYIEWREKRNTQRYVDIKGHNQQIDGKNLLHCRRLLDMAIEIATHKTINVLRPNAEYLLKIRRGEVPLDEIIEKAEQDVKKLDAVYDNSNLPASVDMSFVNELLLEIRHQTPADNT